jgi:phosphoserine phosphatase RsbU/P
MSGTAKFSAGSGIVSGSGHWSWVSGPRRPLVRAWRWVGRSVLHTGRGIALDASGPAQPSGDRARRVVALMLLLAITGAAVAQYTTGRGLIPIAWLSVGPLLASLVLPPWSTAGLAGWALLLGLGLNLGRPGPGGLGMLVSHLSVPVLLAAFAVANSALRTAAQRRLSQVRAVGRVAQSALLREVPATVTTGRLASRYVSAAAEARVGGDLLEVVPDAARPRWLIGDTRGKGLPAVRLASVAMTSFRDACAQPGLSLLEIARVVDRSVTRAAGDEDFVTAVFAELDPLGWLQLVICGHPPPLRLTADGGLQALTPRAYATPLGLHPDLQPSTFTINPGDRLVSIPTACSRRATGRAGTSGWKTAPTRCVTQTCRQPWTGCSVGSSRTPAASSTTMSHCSCWRRHPRSRTSPGGQMIATRHQPARQACH